MFACSMIESEMCVRAQARHKTASRHLALHDVPDHQKSNEQKTFEHEMASHGVTLPLHYTPVWQSGEFEHANQPLQRAQMCAHTHVRCTTTADNTATATATTATATTSAAAAATTAAAAAAAACI
jgi:hypothetical protein